MRLLDSRAVRVVLVWLGATLALKGLAWLAVSAGIPSGAVLDLQTQLAQLQADSWKLVLALIAKWAVEDYAKWIPVPPPQTVVADRAMIQNPPVTGLPPGSDAGRE
jgi:hypothetical protein